MDPNGFASRRNIRFRRVLSPLPFSKRVVPGYQNCSAPSKLHRYNAFTYNQRERLIAMNVFEIFEYSFIKNKNTSFCDDSKRPNRCGGNRIVIRPERDSSRISVDLIGGTRHSTRQRLHEMNLLVSNGTRGRIKL